MNDGNSVIMSDREKQAHRDALLHEIYTKQSGFAKDGLIGNVNESSGRFEFVKETVNTLSSEATSASLENFARYMTQPGRIQSHGVYLLADENLQNKIIACSKNTTLFFGCRPKSILGCSLSDLFLEGAKLSAIQSMPDLSLANPIILTPSSIPDIEAMKSFADGLSVSSSASSAPCHRRVNAIFQRCENGLIIDVEEMGDEAVEGAWQVSI